MSNDVLTFPVEAGVTGTITFRSKSIQFGDGYEQETADGLNTQRDSWPVSASGPLTELQALIDFLNAHPKHITFLWSPPHRAQARYKCGGYTVNNKHGNEVTVSATFVRAYHP